jgi:hypothetical protein
MDVLNGSIAPVYRLTGPTSGFIFGTSSEIIGGRAAIKLENDLTK